MTMKKIFQSSGVLTHSEKAGYHKSQVHSEKKWVSLAELKSSKCDAINNNKTISYRQHDQNKGTSFILAYCPRGEKTALKNFKPSLQYLLWKIK